mgnify:FL=1|tara:strand:- start:4577 stop:4897 length:321 start_codon:yes stop_codon:yes gene_type:complete
MSEDIKNGKYHMLAQQFQKLQSFIGSAKKKEKFSEQDKQQLEEAKNSILDATIAIANHEVEDTVTKKNIDFQTPLDKIRNAREVSIRVRELVKTKREAREANANKK